MSNSFMIKDDEDRELEIIVEDTGQYSSHETGKRISRESLVVLIKALGQLVKLEGHTVTVRTDPNTVMRRGK
jgi:hypothetical protein